ncbi:MULTISPECIES: hypothetical protein [unclassified Streptomyces]|uniref:LppU/SCO3897 family protein n=1 Tax=unclassified Streptomyces TaxID=2593676 RepID=UPI0028883495|nr:hypothetical protein [Streptomyces sp. DSM 41633]
MSSQEMPITITPQQAAHGVILPVLLANGPARLRIPACRNGDLIRARVGDQELLLRIRVQGAGAGAAFATGAVGATGGAGAGVPVSNPSSMANGRGCIAAVLVAAVVAVVLIAVNNGHDDGKNSASPTPTYSSGALSPPSSTPWTAEPTTAPNPVPTRYSPEPAPAPTPESTPEPSPFDRGTCLNGQLPDSTTPQSVSGVDEVSCSASDAHYKVIESIPGTSDMDRCNSNPKTQYAFSYRYMRGATVLIQYVYCLVGLGSYAR